MIKSGYHVIKDHFDGIMNGTRIKGNGLEGIRDVYEDSFGTRISKYDVYTTNLRMSTNPISQIITLVGPADPDLKIGIIPTISMTGSGLACVSLISKDFLNGFDANNVAEYIHTIYHSIENIMIADRLYSMPDRIAINNPYCIFLKCYPLYMTFYHMLTIGGNMQDCYIQAVDEFKDIVDKYIVSGDDSEKVLKSLTDSKYSENFEDIYRALSCKGEVELLN